MPAAISSLHSHSRCCWGAMLWPILNHSRNWSPSTSIDVYCMPSRANIGEVVCSWSRRPTSTHNVPSSGTWAKLPQVRDPEAVTLFRQVLLASASIPVVFPPVRIHVEAGGRVRDELHVDGGTTRKVFIAPLQMSLRSVEPFYSAPPQHRFYIIANTTLAPRMEASRGRPPWYRSKLVGRCQHEPDEPVISSGSIFLPRARAPIST